MKNRGNISIDETLMNMGHSEKIIEGTLSNRGQSAVCMCT